MGECNFVSIIVPVYNVEQYLVECIESIQSQTYSNIEIILVDDGSTDRSGEICDALALNDDRIKVIHKNNGGLMSAWKTGVTYSNGEFLGFVDSDDWVDKDMFARLIEKALSDKSDMVICGLVKEYEDGHREYEENIVPAGVYMGSDIRKRIFPALFNGNNYSSRGITVNRVTKLFRQDMMLRMLNDLSDDVSIGEDLLTTFKYLMKSKCVTIIDDFHPYHYRINNQSMIKKYSDIKYDKINLLRRELFFANCDAYDFSLQINTDYIKLLLIQLDDEILFSGKNYSLLRASIKKRFGSMKFRDILKESEYKKLSRKYRLYLFFIKLHMWDAAILMRMLKQA